jgi:hypothetical protein
MMALVSLFAAIVRGLPPMHWLIPVHNNMFFKARPGRVFGTELKLFLSNGVWLRPALFKFLGLC